MADRLLSLNKNPAARRLASAAGVSLPPTLERDNDPWQERPLQGREVVALMPEGAQLGAALAEALAEAGAAPGVVGELAPFAAAGEGWGRPPRALGREAGERERPYALVFDGTGIRDVAGLKELQLLLQPRVRSLARSGRVLVLGRRPEDQTDPIAASAQRALEGFTRSLAKELGRKGATANLLVVGEGAGDRLAPALRFFLSPRSAYISGQPLTLSRSVRAATPRWTRPLEGKVALVTGAARGIGAATARTLAREGAKVIVLDRPGEEAHASAVAGAIGGEQLMLDLMDPEAPGQIAAYLEKKHGRLDVLVQNAGVTRDRTLAKMSDAEWDLCLGVNLAAVQRLDAAVSGLLSSYARVVYLSSIAGIGGNMGQTNYAASKAGIIGYVEALAPSLTRRGIAANAVAPGFIETRLTAAIPVATREVARRLPNLSQGGLPGDIAEVITFFASPGAHGLTGQVLRVCGGNLMGA
jgi:3-oxoacyl-[acyl-carrier protein] reductase